MQNLVITFIVNISVLLQLCNMMILQIFYQKRHPSPWHVLSSTGCASLQLHARLHTHFALQFTALLCTAVHCFAKLYCSIAHCTAYTAVCTLRASPTACPAPQTLQFTTLCTLHFTAVLQCCAMQNFTSLHTMHCAY